MKIRRLHKHFKHTRASSGYAINNFPLEFADVDNDPNTYNSSRAYIDLNGAKEIGRAYFGVHLDIKALLTEQIFLMKKLVHQFNVDNDPNTYNSSRLY